MSSELVIRPSSLTTFADCQRRWAARTLRDELSAAGYTLTRHLALHAGAAVGSGVHAAAAFSLGEKMATGGASLGSDADAEEVGITELRERVAREGFDGDQATPNVSTAEKQVRRMAKVWRRSDAAAGMPLQVEERLEAEVVPGLALSGQADALMTGSPDSLIRDTKTGSRRANGVQYGAYALIWRAHGHNPEGLVEDFLARVAIAKEQPPVESHRIDIDLAAQEAWEVIQAVGRAVAEFRARVAAPNGRNPVMAFRANPASSLCSARWCPAHGTEFCRAHI